MRQPEGVAALANLDGLEDAGVGELLYGHLHVQLLRGLVVVGLDAPDEVRLGLLDRGHQLRQLAAELLAHRAHFARSALVLRGRTIIW